MIFANPSRQSSLIAALCVQAWLKTIKCSALVNSYGDMQCHQCAGLNSNVLRLVAVLSANRLAKLPPGRHYSLVQVLLFLGRSLSYSCSFRLRVVKVIIAEFCFFKILNSSCKPPPNPLAQETDKIKATKSFVWIAATWYIVTGRLR